MYGTGSYMGALNADQKVTKFLFNMAEIHYAFGLISSYEYQERVNLAIWMDDANGMRKDPQGADDTCGEHEERHVDDFVNDGLSVLRVRDERDVSHIEFLCLNTWVFTKSDPDPYPSVPHGHLKSQNRKWPKLNPHTGRVFLRKYREDVSKRLSKHQMRAIWRDDEFKSFCREIVVWYLEEYPNYRFPVSRPLKMPRW